MNDDMSAPQCAVNDEHGISAQLCFSDGGSVRWNMKAMHDQMLRLNASTAQLAAPL